MDKDFLFGILFLVIVAIFVVIIVVLPKFKKKQQPTDPDSYMDQQVNSQAFVAGDKLPGSDSGSSGNDSGS